MAFVELGEIEHIEGFDEETAQELQDRAREHLQRLTSDLDSKRQELGVQDNLIAFLGGESIDTLKTSIKLAEDDVKSVEDFAGLTPDDLRGWYESQDGERVRHPGLLDEYRLSAEDAEELIMRARLDAGWITEGDYKEAVGVAEEEEAEEEELPEAANEEGTPSE